MQRQLKILYFYEVEFQFQVAATNANAIQKSRMSLKSLNRLAEILKFKGRSKTSAAGIQLHISIISHYMKFILSLFQDCFS